MQKIKINKKAVLKTTKKIITGTLLVAIGALYMNLYDLWVETYDELTEWQAAEDSYFQSKSNEAVSIEPEATPMGETAKGKTIALSDEVAPREEIVASSPTLSNKELIALKGKEVFGENEVSALIELVDRESDFNHLAQNPTSTAFGIFQFLDTTWKGYGCEKTDDPEKQIECGFKYISKRYGTPSQALAYHNQNNWY